MKYDVVIVGAGPAGLMAARTAGKEGLKVALLERKKDITKIHRSCGGVLNVNEPTFGEIVTFDEERKRFNFSNLGISVHYDGPHQDVYGFHIYSPGGKRLEFGNFAELRKNPKKNKLGVSVNKGMLLRGLLEESEKHSVSVFPNTNVCSVQTGPAGAVVECEDGSNFEGTFVIAADGINSRIARMLGLNKERSFFGTTRTASIEIQGTTCPDPDGFLFVITSLSIFAMLPRGEKNCYHIDASTYRREVKPMDLMDYFIHEDPTFCKWFKDSKILEHRTACVVNLMSPPEKPFKDKVLFIGDACWRREISNVGAMCTGWKAGKCIAEALKQGKPDEEGVRDYIHWYQEHFYGPHGKRKQAGRDFLAHLGPENIDYLVELPTREFPQTMDIYKVVNVIGKTYSELMTKIYEEKPDVMERLIEVRENMDGDLGKRIKWGFRNV